MWVQYVKLIWTKIVELIWVQNDKLEYAYKCNICEE